MLKYDGKLLQFLIRMADLLWLNVLTAVCSLAIVTTGPSLCAMHSVLFQMAEGKEPGVTQCFFQEFRKNFRQGAVLGLIFLAVLSLLTVDVLFVFRGGQQVLPLLGGLTMAVGIVCMMYLSWIFPMQSHYISTIGQTLRNAFVFLASHPVHSFAMAVIGLSPALALVWHTIVPISLLFGLSLPAWIQVMIYGVLFRKTDERIRSSADPS